MPYPDLCQDLAASLLSILCKFVSVGLLDLDLSQGLSASLLSVGLPDPDLCQGLAVSLLSISCKLVSVGLPDPDLCQGLAASPFTHCGRRVYGETVVNRPRVVGGMNAMRGTLPWQV